MKIHGRGDDLIEADDGHDSQEVAGLKNQPGSLEGQVLFIGLSLSSTFSGGGFLFTIRPAAAATPIIKTESTKQIHIHCDVVRAPIQARSTDEPKAPPTTPPSTISPYRRLAAPGVTLSFKKAKKVATMTVLNRSPNRKKLHTDDPVGFPRMKA